MNVTVRKAAREDLPALFKLITALAEYEKLEPPGAEQRDRLERDGWPEDGAQPRFTAWLAEAEEAETTQAVGYAISFPTYSTFLAQPTFYIEDIFILPTYRRQAIGSALMTRLIREAWNTGSGRMEWVVLDWNTSAQTFYQRFGASHLSDWQYYRLARNEMEPWLTEEN